MLTPRKSPFSKDDKCLLHKRNQAIIDEVSKLLAAGFICEVYYLDWLANVVLVKMANEKWRICMDFTDLNKAYPKDNFPLPRID